MASDLILHVKKEYFDEILSGKKLFEYRRRSPYWKKRLRKKTFSAIQICSGYPKKGDKDRIIHLKWLGFLEETIVHPHFGKRKTSVFSIFVHEHDFKSEYSFYFDCFRCSKCGYTIYEF